MNKMDWATLMLIVCGIAMLVIGFALANTWDL